MEPRFEKSLTCRICSQPYKDPRILTCLHSFCRECLDQEVRRQVAPDVKEKSITKDSLREMDNPICSERLASKDSVWTDKCRAQEQRSEKKEQSRWNEPSRGERPHQSFMCPTCKKHISIPEGGIKDLPQNFNLHSKVMAAQYQFRILSTQMQSCEVCVDEGSGVAVGFCCTCCQFLCQLCSTYHRRARDLQHKVIPLGKDVSVEMLTAVKPAGPPCSLHNKKLKFYCETCNSLMCRDCTVVAHKDHKHIELPTIAQSFRDEMKSILASAQKVESELTCAIDGGIKKLKELEASEESATQNIKQTFGLLHQAIDDRMNALLEELHTIVLSRRSALNLQKENFEALKQSVGHYSHYSSSIIETYSDHELMALKKMPAEQLQSIIKDIQCVSMLPCERSELAVDVHIQPLITELSGLGHVINLPLSPAKSIWVPISLPVINIPYKLEIQTNNSEGQKYLYGGSNVMAEVRSKKSGTIKGEVKYLNDGTYTVTFTPLVSGPHQLIITINGQHIKNSPYNLEVRASKPNYTAACQKAQHFCRGITSPLCMAIHSNGDIFIGSETNCIYVINEKSEKRVQKTTIGSAGNGPGQFNKPNGLAIKGDVLYVADCKNHRIQKLTTSGDFLHMFGKFGSAQGEFNSPCAVVVDSNDRLIIADQGNKRIQVMNLDGTCFLTISVGNTLPVYQVYEMVGGLATVDSLCLALDSKGNIYIGSTTTCIQVFTPRGVLTRSFGGSTSCICITYDDTVLVGDSRYTFTVYDPSGNTLASANIQGTPKGIVMNPYSSHIYVLQETLQYAYNTGPGHTSTHGDVLLIDC